MRKVKPGRLTIEEVVSRPVTQTRCQQKSVDRPFVAWDGEECKDADYCLFGNSAGFEVCKPELSSDEMLDLVIRTGKAVPGAFHVGYAFFYDVNNIIKDIGKVRVHVLHKCGRVRWHGYEIAYIPHKIFTVSKYDVEAGKTIRVRIDDVFSFFRKRFDKPLKTYQIGTEDERKVIEYGKEHRSTFVWAEIESIRDYFRMELKYLVMLMDRVRRDMNSVGIFIGQWHGPGAIASWALKKHGMQQFKRKTPDEILDAVKAAYSAGWFERFQAGYHDGEVWTADINSAYVYAISLLPNLAHGTWTHVDRPDRETVRGCRFGVFHIRLKGGFSEYLASCHGIPQPLPLRDTDGSIHHPVSCDGWYWAPEATLVSQHPKAEFVEAWIFLDDGTKPFAWVADMYADRLSMQESDNPAEKILKWLLASIYGRVAQRVGWNEKTGEPPAWHQLEWAGFITSMCRSMIFLAAIDCAKRNGLVSIDTDGLISTVPIRIDSLINGMGDGLGQWKIEYFTALIYIQNGIYWMKKEDGTWEEPKLRGIPKEQVKDQEDAMMVLRGEGCKCGDMTCRGKIHLEKQSFTGYGIALYSNWSEWRQWKSRPHVIDVEDSGKRRHSKKLCRACRAGYGLSDCLHDLAPLIPRASVSQPHSLPWENPKKTDLAMILKQYQGIDDF